MRYVARRLADAPLFTCVAVITLAVGIGANSAIFSVVNGVLLKPLPFVDPDRLVGIWHTAPGLGYEIMNQGPAFHFTYRDEKRAFEDVGMWDTNQVSVTGHEEPERVQALNVTDGVLPVLRAQPMLGRAFTPADDTPGSPETVILGFAYWQRKFGGDAGVVGRKLIVDGRPRDIIGVMPRDFRFLDTHPSLLMPFQFRRNEVYVGNFSFQGLARLKPGVTLEQANADVSRMIPIVTKNFPLPPGFTVRMLEEARFGPRVHPLKEDAVGDVGRVLWILLGTVGMVLLIACANVANLFLVRAEGRQRELAVRTAMGASWRQIAQELLLETVVLGILGGALGLFLAYEGIRLLLAIGPEYIPRLEEIAIDPAVLLFTLAISLLAGLLFGLIPVFKHARPEVSSALKEVGRTFSDGKERHRVRDFLVVSQIALALVLLVSSGLMIRTFRALRNVEPGFARAEEVLTFRLFIPEAEIPDDEQATRLYERIMHRIEEIPGVDSVGLSNSITMDGYDDNDPVFVEDFPIPEGQFPAMRRYKWIGPNYFATMGNPMRAGRDITWTDLYNKTPVAIITENLAREYWKDPGKAIGRRIRGSPKDPWREIIGVTGNEHDDGVHRPATFGVYWPMMMDNFWTNPTFVRRNMAFAVRSGRIGESGFLREIQQAVWGSNPNLPLANVRTLSAMLEESMARTSFTLVLLGIAAVVALVLGLVGIYGVISYSVSQRNREIGIRIALGAEPGAVRRLFVGQGARLACAGIALGLGVAVGLTRLMSALLFGVNPVDPLTFGTVALVLGLVALAATYIPAWRASSVDPVEALRWE